jgi:hypothetical protein
VEGREQHTMDGLTQNKGKALSARPHSAVANVLSEGNDPRLSETRHTLRRL